jgi:hypothetical protein
VAVERLIQVAMPRAKVLNFLHLAVISPFTGKEVGKSGLEFFIRMSGSSKQLSASRTQRLRHAWIFMPSLNKVHRTLQAFYNGSEKLT